MLGRNPRGGLIGYGKNGEITNCSYSGKVSVTGFSKGATASYKVTCCAGGIAGKIDAVKGGNYVISQSTVAEGSAVDAEAYVIYSGGIVGHYNASGIISGCVAECGVSASSSEFSSDLGSEQQTASAHAGGIAGRLEYALTVGSCYHEGTVSAEITDPATNKKTPCAGGIVGYAENCGYEKDSVPLEIENCIHVGKISAQPSGNCGAILGSYYSDTVENSAISNCAWYCPDNDSINAVGVADVTENDIKLSNCEKLALAETWNNSAVFLTASIDTSSLTAESKAVITLTTKPGVPDDAFGDYGAVRKISAKSDSSIVLVKQGEEAGKLTVEPLFSGQTTVTVTAYLHRSLSSDPGGYAEEGTLYSFAFPITVSGLPFAAETQDAPSGGGGGGCSAGFGALALLAAVPLAAFARKLRG